MIGSLKKKYLPETEKDLPYCNPTIHDTVKATYCAAEAVSLSSCLPKVQKSQFVSGLGNEPILNSSSQVETSTIAYLLRQMY